MYRLQNAHACSERHQTICVIRLPYLHQNCLSGHLAHGLMFQRAGQKPLVRQLLDFMLHTSGTACPWGLKLSNAFSNSFHSNQSSFFIRMSSFLIILLKSFFTYWFWDLIISLLVFCITFWMSSVPEWEVIW